MGKVIQFPREHKERNRAYQQGYSDGYNDRDIKIGMPDIYYEGFDVGTDDHAEDLEAMESGEFDLLDEDERREIYGDESDQP